MTPSEKFALKHVLAGFSKNLSFGEVLDLIESEDKDIIIFAPFENLHPAHIVEHVMDAYDSAERFIFPLHSTLALLCAEIEEGCPEKIATEFMHAKKVLNDYA